MTNNKNPTPLFKGIGKDIPEGVTSQAKGNDDNYQIGEQDKGLQKKQTNSLHESFGLLQLEQRKLFANRTYWFLVMWSIFTFILCGYVLYKDPWTWTIMPLLGSAIANVITLYMIVIKSIFPKNMVVVSNEIILTKKDVIKLLSKKKNNTE